MLITLWSFQLFHIIIFWLQGKHASSTNSQRFQSLWQREEKKNDYLEKKPMTRNKSKKREKKRKEICVYMDSCNNVAVQSMVQHHVHKKQERGFLGRKWWQISWNYKFGNHLSCFFFHFLNWQIPNEKHAWEKIIIKKYKKKEIGEVEDDGEIEKLETFCMEPRNFVPSPSYLSPIHEEKIWTFTPFWSEWNSKRDGKKIKIG